jgi:hypothetical protein
MLRFICLTAIILFNLATPAYALTNPQITKDEVLAAQKIWADGIVDIGKVFKEKGDYKARAIEHINSLYAYKQGKVLFKPTLASDDQFRETFDQALSYFIGGENKEDKGFAIKPWSKVRFGEEEILTDSDSATAMGNYYFTADGDNKEIKVEFTFGYIKDAEGKVRINVHHSSLPYQKQ